MRVVFVALLTAMAAVHEPVTVEDIDSAIRWLTRSAPRSNPMQTDPEMRRTVAVSVSYAVQQWPVDVWLVLSIISYESSFKHWSEGDLGEIGLMQFHGSVKRECVKDGFDLLIIDGQINCGVRHLHRQIEKHGKRGGLIEYMSGHYKRHTATTESKAGYRLLRAQRLASRPWEE